MESKGQQFGSITSPDISGMSCSRNDTTLEGVRTSDVYVIGYLTEGQGIFNGHIVNAGQGFLIYPETAYEFHAESGQYIRITSSDERMGVIFETFKANPDNMIFNCRYIDACRSAYARLAALRSHDLGYFDIYSIFTSIMQAHFTCIKEEQVQRPSEVYLQYALHYIQRNYAGKVRVEELTERLGISQPHLYHIFMDNLGVSPKEYINRFRIEQAIRLLMEAEIAIADVGKAVGYDDPMSFSRFFSRRQGISPSQFRKKYLEEAYTTQQ